jgi:hypothetical protein
MDVAERREREREECEKKEENNQTLEKERQSE